MALRLPDEWRGRGPRPVLILYGPQAEKVWAWFKKIKRHVAEYVPDAAVREISEAGHMRAWVQPKPYAEEMIHFFANEKE
jgi:pimeloyl-ACP methyl ester carboxylesterase